MLTTDQWDLTHLRSSSAVKGAVIPIKEAAYGTWGKALIFIYLIEISV